MARVSSGRRFGAYALGLITILAALTIPGTPAQEPQGRVWTVCAEGCDFGSIQEAIDIATDGDTVRVFPGGYHENVVVEKAITLEGVADEETGEAVTIYPKNFEEPTLLIRRTGLLSSLEGVVVRGFVIRSLEWIPGSPPRAGVAVRVDGVGTVLEGNRIVEGIGISAFVLGGTQIMLRGNEIVGSGAVGIRAAGDGRLVVEDNRVEGKHVGMGIGNLGFLDAELRGNLVQNNYTGLSLISLGSSGEILGEDNKIVFNVIGVELMGSVAAELNRNEIARNINWGLILHRPACTESFSPEGEFRGTVRGQANVMYDNGNGNLCPEDYPWPEGFVRPPEE